MLNNPTWEETTEDGPSWEETAADSPKPPTDFSQIKINPSFQPSQFGSGASVIDPAGESERLLPAFTALPEALWAGVGLAGDVARGAATDAVAGYTGALTGKIPENSGNLAERFVGNEMPVDIQNRELSEINPRIATLGKVGQGVIGSAPLLVAGAGLGTIGQRLLAAGFSAHMISGAPKAAEELGTELGKNKQDQDKDKITSLSSELIQIGAFAPLAGAHGLKPGAPKPFEKFQVTPRELKPPPQTHAEVAAELGLKPVADVGGMWQFNVTDAAGKEIPFAVKAGAPKADITARAEMLKKELGGERPPSIAPEITEFTRLTSDVKSKAPSTEAAQSAGMKSKTISDLDHLMEAQRNISAESKQALKDAQADAPPDQKRAALDRMASLASGRTQLPREAIEAATNSGSGIEGEGSLSSNRLGPRPLDWKSNAEARAWLEKNGKELWGETGDHWKNFQEESAKIKAPNEKAQAPQGQEILDEAVETTALDPNTGSPLSATDALINKLESTKPVTGKPLTREQQRNKNIQERADAKQAEVQRNIESGKSPVEPPVKEFNLDEQAPTPLLEPVGMGAAAAGEVTPSPKTATGIKNAQVDIERQQRGLPPAVQPVKRAFGKVWDDAMASIDRDPGVPDRLINELRDKPRALTDLEDATLLHRQIDLQNEYGKATRDLAQAFDDGRVDSVPLEQARVQALSDQLLDLYNIGKKVGTETGRGLNARKMMAMEDFSLAKMELEKRAANEGRPLTPKERTELVDANKRIEETQKKFDEYVTKTDRQLAERDMRAALDEMQKDVKSSKPKFPKSEDVEAQKQKIKLRLDEGERSDVSSLVQKLARMFVEQGIRVRDPLIDAVHGVLKEIDPQFTRRETMDAISGYGDFKQLTKDEISLKVRDLKGQMQQVAKLEDMQANKPPLKTGVERRIPSTEESRLIRLVNEAKNQFQIPITDPATQLKSSLDTLKARLKNETAKWEDKLKRSDFAKKPKRVIQMDAEANKLHFENAQAKAKWHEALMKDRLARRSLPQKIFAGVGETINTARAIMTSFDLSAVLRQGGFIALGHPFRAAKSFPAMFKAFGSEAAQHAVNREITNRKSYPLMAQSKLYLSEHGQKLSQMEEAYMSRWADKIPLVAGSQRAYTTFLNKLRADSFDAMANSLSAKGELTPVEANAIANYINIATGRGNLGMRDNALVGLNTVFFAPRYVASRFQLALGQPMYRGSARTRVVVAKEYARYLAGLGVVYALGQSAGADVETDPRSADFGKMRWGNTRLDPLSGLSQTTALMSRLASGETKTLKGEIKPIRGPDVPFGSGNSADVMARFLRTKLAPAPGAIVDVLSGKDVVGNEVTAASTAQHLMTPLAMRDIYNAMLEQGIPEGTALGLLSVFGMGLQTYEDKK